MRMYRYATLFFVVGMAMGALTAAAIGGQPPVDEEIMDIGPSQVE